MERIKKYSISGMEATRETHPRPQHRFLKLLTEKSTLVGDEILRHTFSMISLMRVISYAVLLVCLGIFSCTSRDPVAEPKLSSIQHEIFDRSCNAASCHGSGMKGGLSLLASGSHQQLVGVVSVGDHRTVLPLLRVNAGKPDSSFLYLKLVALADSQGVLMPKGADKLSQENIEAVRTWIANGARDD